MQYDAFLSYSHAADRPVAASLQKGLQSIARPWHRRRVTRVFRDKSGLSPTEALWATIQERLDAANFLILLCCPEAADSKWVSREVGAWIARKTPGHTILVLTRGSIEWSEEADDIDWERTDAVPRVLSGYYREEPLWLDLRWIATPADRALHNARFRDAVAEVCATLRGTTKDEITGEDLRQRRTFLRAAWSAAIVLFLTTALATFFAVYANIQRQRAVAAERASTAELARSLWTRGLSARDDENDPLTALLCLSRAAQLAARSGQPDLFQRAVLASRLLGRHVELQRIIDLGSPVTGMIFDEAGTLWVALTLDGTVRLWDARTGESRGAPMRHVSGPGSDTISQLHQEQLRSELLDHAEFDPTGTRLLTLSRNLAAKTGVLPLLTEPSQGRARVWDTATGLAKTPVLAHEGSVSGAFFDGDGRRIVTWGGNAVRIWNSDDGAPMTPPMMHGDILGAVALSPDESRLLTTSRDGFVRVWDTRTGELAIPAMDHQENPPHLGALSSDGRSILAAGFTAWSLWDAETGQPRTPLLTTKVDIRRAIFWPDDRKVLLWGGPDPERLGMRPTSSVLQLCNSADGTAATSIMWHPDASILGVRPCQRRRRIVSWGTDRTIRVWNADNGKIEADVMQHEGNIRGVILSHDEHLLVSWTSKVEGGYIVAGAHIWDAETGRQIGEALPHNASIRAAGFVRGSHTFVTSSTNGMVRMWDGDTAQPLTPQMAHAKGLVSMHVSPNEAHALSWGEDGCVRVWKAYRGSSGSVNAAAIAPVETMFFGPTGQRLYARGPGGVLAWDLGSEAAPSVVARLEAPLRGADLDEGGRRLVVWSETSARVFDALTGATVSDRIESQATLKDVSLRPDGQQVLTCGEDGKAWLWEARPGAGDAGPLEHGETIQAGAFGRDGRRVLLFGGGQISVWDAEAASLVARPIDDWNQLGGRFSSAGDRFLSWGGAAELWLSRRADGSPALIWSSGSGDRPMNIGTNVPFDYNFCARVWQVTSGEPVTPRMSHNDVVVGATFDEHARRVLSWSVDKTARLWHADTGDAIGPPLAHGTQVIGGAFLGGGTVAVTWGLEGTVHRWDPASGKSLGRPLRTGGLVEEVKVLGATHVVTKTSEGIARIWDGATGDPLARPLILPGGIRGTALAPDENTLVIWNAEGLVRTVDLSLTGHLPNEHLGLEMEVRTGATLDEALRATVLSPGAWRERRMRYEELRR